jgi:hypothetical protein
MNTDSVLTVGSGRGFIVEHRTLFDFGNGYTKLRRKVVVTASHCLPHAPKVFSGVDYQLATYPKLQRKRTGSGAGVSWQRDDKQRRADADAMEWAAAHTETRAPALAA